MRDRLIELLKKMKKDPSVTCPYINDTQYGCPSECKYNLSKGRCDYTARTAGYLIANGVIVPPCKVGDTVYHFCDEFGCILPYFVETFNIGFLDKDRNYWSWEANSHTEETDEFLDEIDFDLDDIGKTVFLTKEEAEKALEEIEGMLCQKN